MLSITHAVVGAAVGQRINQPVIAFGVGVVAHFITDKIPHVWPNEKKQQDTVILVDAIITTIFISFCVFTNLPNKTGLIAGALGGAIVDALLVLTPLVNSKIGKWHTKRQPHKTEKIYYLTDLAQIVLAALVLWSFR